MNWIIASTISCGESVRLGKMLCRQKIVDCLKRPFDGDGNASSEFLSHLPWSASAVRSEIPPMADSPPEELLEYGAAKIVDR